MKHLVFILVVLTLAGSATAGPIILPVGPNAPQQVRYALITSVGRDSGPTNISTYDIWAAAIANAVPELAALNTTWSVIASVPTVWARGHVLMDDAVGVPIYRLDGQLVASTYAAFWSAGVAGATLNACLCIDEHGDMTTATRVWTGTHQLGYGSSSLGTNYGTTGNPLAVNKTWTNNFVGADVNQLYPMYIVSGIIESGDLSMAPVPEPTTLFLFGTGLAALARGVRRRKA